ncbi:MAG: D-alanine--D-alanine ligase, partial [Rikenella sp.]|nr:D-alanine--D-alanine ligase [Rikenella sp.]
MSERKIIAVIAGGDSSEDVISYRSGAQVYGCLDRAVYEPYFVVLRRGVWRVNPVDATPEGATVPVDLNDFGFIEPRTGRRVKFDYALIEIHGTPGENGILQGDFELM